MKELLIKIWAFIKNLNLYPPQYFYDTEDEEEPS